MDEIHDIKITWDRVPMEAREIQIADLCDKIREARLKAFPDIWHNYQGPDSTIIIPLLEAALDKYNYQSELIAGLERDKLTLQALQDLQARTGGI